jgi:hypothetical protein
MTLLHAVRGPQPEIYGTHATGHNEVAPARGNNPWLGGAPPGCNGQQAYLLLRDGAGASAASAIDALLPHPCPRNFSAVCAQGRSEAGEH